MQPQRWIRQDWTKVAYFIGKNGVNAAVESPPLSGRYIRDLDTVHEEGQSKEKSTCKIMF